ncbi:DUF4157 domain-containing protein [Duganella sp. BJB1802]|uniref:eCIS core domain-containing protein n=1 Tax=Duganella sp. BJB1802 TaxID=2744575 RepID=UPI0015944C73|nr:DUF4157 domain-containing protein [Duganella sp. BJB1802]NVD74747.1 DUF4157 domain-containing protein [Duganella sp. BJB1802]
MFAAQQSSRSGANPAQPVPPALLQRKCSCAEQGGSCERCSASGNLARASSNAAAPGGAPASVGRVLDSPGQGLDTATKGLMESRFGHDFSHVRIHADSEANASASAIHASAYTVGNHVAFAGGRYQPGDPDGQMLLAHELTHVVQQGGTKGPLQRSPDGEVTMQDNAADEDQADIAAEAVSFGWKVNVPAKQSATGVAKAPLTYGDAAGGCGICYRGNVRQVGTDAHTQIQTAMQAMYRFLIPNFVVQTKKKAPFLALDPKKVKGLSKALKKAKGVFKKLVPDLIMATPTGFALGEIKPFNSEGLIEGEAKLQLYENILKERYIGVNPGLTLTRMTLPPPPPLPFLDPLAITCRQWLGVLPPARGLYMYLCTPPFSNELRKKCRCVGDAKEGEDKATKTTNKGFGISIGSTSTSMYSAGIGVSIYSSGLGAGNAGVGVSIASSSIGAGNASAGAAVTSSGQSVASVGAGASVDTTSTGAGTAGAGYSNDTTSKAAGAAGVGTSTGTDVKAAGVAGAGSVKNSDVTATGTAGTGNVEDASGTAGGKKTAPPAHRGSAEGKGTTGATGTATGTSGTATGATATGDKTGTGTGTGTGSGTKSEGPGGAPKTGGPGTGQGQAGSQPGDAKGAAGGTSTTGQPGGTSGQGTQKQGSDLLTEKEMAVFGLKGKPITHDQLDAALAQARIIRELIDKSSPAQQALLRAIADNSPEGQYTVPASTWIQKVLAATQGISEEDIAYLKTLNWKPAKVTPEELRKSVLAALAKKPKTPPKQQGTDQGGGKSETEGKGEGKPGTSGKGTEGAGSKGTGQPGAKGGEVTKYRVSTDETNTARDFWFVNFSNFDVHNAAVGESVMMTLAFFAEDKGIYTFKLKFVIKERNVASETSKEKGKTITRKAVTFKLEGVNDARWDIAPPGKRPFILPKNVHATFKGFL